MAYKELSDHDDFLWLRTLTRNLSVADAVRLLDATMLLEREEGKRLAEAERILHDVEASGLLADAA